MSYKDNAKDSFRRIFGKAEDFSLKKNKEDMERLENRTTFIDDSDDVIEEGTFSKDKRLKKKANSVKGINFISLPKFLKRDCDKSFSYLNLAFHYLIAFLIIVVVGWIFKLNYKSILVLLSFYFIFAPSLIYHFHRKKYEQYMFGECVRYVEQMIYSFTRKTKVLTALQETRLVVDGRLGQAIDFAINRIQNGTVKEGTIYSYALKEVEAILPCSRVKNLHEFLAEVENVGGKHNTSLDIMLEDLREWDVRTGQFQQNQTTKSVGMLFSIIMSMGTCLFMSSILPADMGGDISGFAVYQWLTTIAFIVMFFIYRMVDRKLTKSWIVDDYEMDQDQIDRDCEKIHNYFETGKGLKPTVSINRIKKELEKKFPRWVMRFSLLASTQSIPAALRNSIASCPNVMRRELENLVHEIEMNPTGIEPYLGFFEYIDDMPQLRSMMLMVYSLSEYSSDDIDKHVLSIVRRNYLLQATAETIENDESLARFSLYVTLPMILACIIMMIDVAMVVLNMITFVTSDLHF